MNSRKMNLEITRKIVFLESHSDNIWRILVITQLESSYLLLGFDADEKTGVATIGSILRLKQASQISLDGEGAVFVVADPKEPQTTQCLYKPVSLQGLWSLHSTVLRLIYCSELKINEIERNITSPRHLRNKALDCETLVR